MPRKPHPLDPFARSLLLGLLVEHRRRRAKTPYSYGAVCDGVRLTIGLRAAPAVRDPAFDLPEPLRTPALDVPSEPEPAAEGNDAPEATLPAFLDEETETAREPDEGYAIAAE